MYQDYLNHNIIEVKLDIAVFESIRSQVSCGCDRRHMDDTSAAAAAGAPQARRRDSLATAEYRSSVFS